MTDRAGTARQHIEDAIADALDPLGEGSVPWKPEEVAIVVAQTVMALLESCPAVQAHAIRAGMYPCYEVVVRAAGAACVGRVETGPVFRPSAAVAEHLQV